MLEDSNQAPGVISQEDRAELRDLQTHPGFRLYQTRLRDLLRELKMQEHGAKTWEETLKYRGMVDQLEHMVLPMVKELLEED